MVFGYLQSDKSTSILPENAPDGHIAIKEDGEIVTKHIDEIVTHRVPEASGDDQLLVSKDIGGKLEWKVQAYMSDVQGRIDVARSDLETLMDTKDTITRDLIPTPYYDHRGDTNGDLNVGPYTTQGVHYLYDWANLQNAPTNLNSFELIVTTKVFENYVTQKLFAVFSLKKYVRIRKGVGVPWTAWTSSEDLSQETLESIMDTKDNALTTTLESTMDSKDSALRTTLENTMDSKDNALRTTLESTMDSKDNALTTTLESTMDSKDNTLRMTLENTMDNKDSTLRTTLENTMDSKDNALTTTLESTMDTKDNASRLLIENKIYQPYQDDRGLPTNTVIDLDTKTASGVYLMYKLGNLQNGPTEDISSYEIILDVKLFDTYVIQELIAVFSERRYSRLRKGSAWSGWKRIDIDGIDLNPRTIINHPTAFDFNSNLDDQEIYVYNSSNNSNAPSDFGGTTLFLLNNKTLPNPIITNDTSRIQEVISVQTQDKWIRVLQAGPFASWSSWRKMT